MPVFPQGQSLLNSFIFPLWMGHMFLFIGISHKVLLKTGHFKYCDMETLEIRFYIFPGFLIYALCRVAVVCLVSFLNFFSNHYIFYRVWSLKSLFLSLVISYWFDRDFFKCLDSKNKQKQEKKNLKSSLLTYSLHT